MKAITVALAQELGDKLKHNQLKVTVAESCTGGAIAAAITDIAGSSQWFEQSVVVYSNRAKVQQLGVSAQLLMEHGAVSQPVVEAMAVGALANFGADLSVAVSGIAGPDGGSEEKPVGTVWLAWADKNGVARLEQHEYHGGRSEVRNQAVLSALRGLIELASRAV
jgi:nicotinamide-nucleotide amidase